MQAVGVTESTNIAEQHRHVLLILTNGRYHSHSSMRVRLLKFTPPVDFSCRGLRFSAWRECVMEDGGRLQ